METMATGTQFILFLLLPLISLSRSQDVRMPPSLIKGPTALIHYKESTSVTLHCEGVGSPAPFYEWTRNGEPLNANADNIIFPTPGVGTIVINPCRATDQGYYQCKLTNSYGMTMSNMTFLQMATLETFPPQTESTSVNVDINGHVCLACAQLQSIPASNIFWSYNSTAHTGQPTPVIESAKIQTNPFSGELCLTHVQVDDGVGSNNKMYICNVQNKVLSTTESGSKSRIITTGTSSASYAAMLTFGSAATLVGLEGDPLTLRGFFSGSPIPMIIWRKNGETPPQTRWSVSNSGTGLNLIGGRLAAEDAGEYTCQGSNGVGSAVTHTIQLTIHARPVFLSNDFRPHDMNVTDGETVTINCDPYAIPDATINWYKNGVFFTAGSLPPKFSLSADFKTLTISGVCKDCNEGNSGDLMNIQCNASNVYGYGFAQGYLNVLEATVITSVGGNRVWNPYTNEVFDCQATSDDSTPVGRTWYYNEAIVQYSATVTLAPNGSLVLLMQNDTDGGQSRIGQYKCVASNGFSEAELIYTLEENVRMPPSLVTGPTALIHYKETASVTLQCVGIGTPAPNYKWTKNGQPLNVNSGNIEQLPGFGTIVINPCLAADQGYYQCLLTNSFGKTMSNMTFLQMATLQTFPPQTEATPYNVDINGHVCLACAQLPSIPASHIYWTYNFTGHTGQPIRVTPTSKIQTNPITGELCLTHVQTDDGAGSMNKMYICNAYNAVLSRIESGSHSRIITTGTTSSSYAPFLTFGSASALIGLEGDPLTLRCFFSSSPIPMIIWRKNGETPPQNRWQATNSGTGLTLTSKRLTAEDAGEFTCQGSNGIGSPVTHTIQLTIRARPFFLNNSFQPHDMNVTEGETVTIKCDPIAIPNATINWFKNGVAFTACSTPPKFSLSADSKTLTIFSVCKTCYYGNTGDLMNIQCNASNEYGYGFAQGYLNILEAPVITMVGGNRVWIPYTNEVLDCQAISDHSIPVGRAWYYNDTVVQESETVILAANGSLVLLMQNEADGGQSLIGQYRCVVSNGFNKAELIYTLDGASHAKQTKQTLTGILSIIILMNVTPAVLF